MRPQFWALLLLAGCEYQRAELDIEPLAGKATFVVHGLSGNNGLAWLLDGYERAVLSHFEAADGVTVAPAKLVVHDGALDLVGALAFPTPQDIGVYHDKTGWRACLPRAGAGVAVTHTNAALIDPEGCFHWEGAARHLRLVAGNNKPIAEVDNLRHAWEEMVAAGKLPP